MSSEKRVTKIRMNNIKLAKIRDLLEHNNLSLGKELGYTHTQYQCKQVDNLISGTSKIKPILILALECLARRKSKLKEFNNILKE